jgi:restriction system protein
VSAGKKPYASDPNAPLCPKCGSPMVKRNGPRGEFWGCSTFPKCKGTRNL